MWNYVNDIMTKNCVVKVTVTHIKRPLVRVSKPEIIVTELLI